MSHQYAIAPYVPQALQGPVGVRRLRLCREAVKQAESW